MDSQLDPEPHLPGPALPMESSGDSEADLDPSAAEDDEGAVEDDDKESCCLDSAHVDDDHSRRDDEQEEAAAEEEEDVREDDGEGRVEDESAVTWSSRKVTGFELGKGEEEEEEENRQFWETCLASGYP